MLTPMLSVYPAPALESTMATDKVEYDARFYERHQKQRKTEY